MKWIQFTVILFHFLVKINKSHCLAACISFLAWTGARVWTTKIFYRQPNQILWLNWGKSIDNQKFYRQPNQILWLNWGKSMDNQKFYRQPNQILWLNWGKCLDNQNILWATKPSLVVELGQLELGQPNQVLWLNWGKSLDNQNILWATKPSLVVELGQELGQPKYISIGNQTKSCGWTGARAWTTKIFYGQPNQVLWLNWGKSLDNQNILWATKPSLVVELGQELGQPKYSVGNQTKSCGWPGARAWTTKIFCGQPNQVLWLNWGKSLDNQNILWATKPSLVVELGQELGLPKYSVGNQTKSCGWTGTRAWTTKIFYGQPNQVLWLNWGKSLDNQNILWATKPSLVVELGQELGQPKYSMGDQTKSCGLIGARAWTTKIFYGQPNQVLWFNWRKPLDNQNILWATKPSLVVAPGTTGHKNFEPWTLNRCPILDPKGLHLISFRV